MNVKADSPKELLNSRDQLTIDLFHGTSSLFLDSILSHGLGGINPVKDWKILEIFFLSIFNLFSIIFY